MNIETIVNDFKQVAPEVAFWSLRLVVDRYETLNVREGVPKPPLLKESRGAHISIVCNGGYGYAATCQLNRAGLRQAAARALEWARQTSRLGLSTQPMLPRPAQSGSYRSRIGIPWDSMSVADKIDLLQAVNRELKVHESIADWQASLSHRDVQSWLITCDDVRIEQQFSVMMPGYDVFASKGGQTQRRSGGGWASGRQGGLEQLQALHFSEDARRVAEEAIALVEAPDCPTGTMSVLLMPSQMGLQIHESIGHPLELDRILGDERNFAGGSFVTPAMVGSYRYGSELLNVTHDPSIPEEIASYGFDDEGTPAQKCYLIRDGVLERVLGSAGSRLREGLPGTANARAAGWDRPAIDRMANLNIEPGSSSMTDLIGSIEHGVLMDTNLSWSIDDQRNKFQFGCEFGRRIENGELKNIVKNPNYRGVSTAFWRSLAGVGDATSFDLWSALYCGKGEPHQMLPVGHGSPACVFHDVEVFGGD